MILPGTFTHCCHRCLSGCCLGCSNSLLHRHGLPSLLSSHLSSHLTSFSPYSLCFISSQVRHRLHLKRCLFCFCHSYSDGLLDRYSGINALASLIPSLFPSFFADL